MGAPLRSKLETLAVVVLATGVVAASVYLVPPATEAAPSNPGSPAAAEERAKLGDGLGASVPPGRVQKVPGDLGHSGGETTLLGSPFASSVIVHGGGQGLMLVLTEGVSDDPGHPFVQAICSAQAPDQPAPPPGIHEGVFEYRTSFAVDLVCGRGSHEAYLAGNRLLRDGTRVVGHFVIERWRFEEQNGAGALSLSYPSSSIALGSPTPLTAPIFSLHGPRYIEADKREAPRDHRTLIYSGTTLGDLGFIVADPDDRFVLVYSTTDSALVQIESNGTGTIHSVLTATEQPALSSAVNAWAVEHSTEGRMFLVFCEDAAGTVLLLWDTDRDGFVPDQISSMTREAWKASTFSNTSGEIRQLDWFEN